MSSSARCWTSAGLAIIDVERDELRVRHVNGATLTARGALADELLSFIDTGALGPRLAIVAAGFSEGLDGLAGAGREALTTERALALAGFDTLFLEVVGRCNERCVHCYADSSPEVDAALSREECLRLIDEAAALGFSRVQLTGGDPLLCAFLPELVARATERALVAEIYTNGLALTDALLSRLGAARFAFSYYSHRAEVHDAITRTPHSHANTTRAISRVVAAGLPVRVAVIVMEENAADVAATLEHVRALGVADVGWTSARAVGRGRPFEGDVAAPRATHSGGGASAAGKLAVASDGAVFPCIFNRGAPLGSIRERSLVDIVRAPSLRRSLLATAHDDALECTGCRLTAAALRAYARGAT